MQKNNEALNLKLLAGEPTDGTGRLCIHYLVEDAAGQIKTSGSLPKALAENPASKFLGISGPRSWKIACRPEQNSVQPQVRNGQRYMCLHSNDIHAVTCPQCLESAEAKLALRTLEESPDKEKVAAFQQQAALAVAG